LLASRNAPTDALALSDAQNTIQRSLLAVALATAMSGCGSPGASEPSGPGTIIFTAQPSTEEFEAQLFAIGGDGSGLRQVTTDDSVKTTMAVSPDGSQVAYAGIEFDSRLGSDESRLTSIYLVALDGSGERPLCSACSRTLYSQVPGPGIVIDNAGAADYAVPDSLAWSPDGARLAAPAASNGLLIIEVASGSTSLIETDEPVTALAWSPDGSAVAASHTWFLSPHSTLGEMTPTDGTWWWESRTDEERPGGIYLVDVTARTVEEIVSTDGIAHVHGWSPDGSLIAYNRVAGHGKHAELAAYSVEDRRSWTLAPAERGSADQGAAWSPNGDRFAALIEQFDEEHDPMLWTSSASGHDQQTAPVCAFEGARDGQCYTPGIAWSPDGADVAYRASIQHTPLIHVIVVHDVASGQERVFELPKLFADYSGGFCCIAWTA
jgi:sugar lactone lactonase YvrE